jgi:nucleotide-binding universal stress UspA family protein
MPKLKRVLATTDLSAPARLAVERAALISKQTGSRLELLHVANLPYLDRLRQMVATTPPDLQEQVLATARTRLQELGDDIAKRHGTSPDMHVVTGSPVAELVKKINDRSADLIVCGAKGESIVRHALIGSTAQRLLSRARSPILVVKQPSPVPYRSALIPVDFSPSSLCAIRHAKAIAPDAHFTLLHVYEVPFEGHMRYASVDNDVIQHYRVRAKREATSKIHALAEEAKLLPGTSSVVIVHGDPTLRITMQEKVQKADLIVMGKHGEGMLEKLLLGSVTSYVLAESQCDVLISVMWNEHHLRTA